MGFLDWVKRRDKTRMPEPEDEPAPARYFTQRGSAITIQSSSEWASDGVGVYEMRHHVGKSSEGYHGGLETSRQGGESSWQWTNTRPTAQSAEKAAYRMGVRWMCEMEPEFDRVAGIQQEQSQSRSDAKISEKETSRSWDR